MLERKILTQFWTYWIVILFRVSTSWCLYTNYAENTEIIQQRAGNDIKLQCNLKGLVSDQIIGDIKIRWFFKQCTDYPTNEMASCQNFQKDDWTQLPCEENFCKPELHLKNITEKYSGLYKCTIYPYRLDDSRTLDIQLVRTYQLDVKNTSIGLPEFVDSYPLNKTTVVGYQVVLQCRVHSEVHPTIRWFRRIPDVSAGQEQTLRTDNFSTHIVEYNGYTYELIDAGHEKYIGDETYLSKLILNSVRLQDEGFYACAAISYHGHRIREAYLRVYTQNEEYWSEYDDSDELQTDPSEFGLLFLIPLGLALLPISFWLLYAAFKKFTTNNVEGELDKQQYSHEHMLGDQWRLSY